MSANTTDLKAQFENQYDRSEPSLDDHTQEAAEESPSCLCCSCN